MPKRHECFTIKALYKYASLHKNRAVRTPPAATPAVNSARKLGKIYSHVTNLNFLPQFVSEIAGVSNQKLGTRSPVTVSG